MFKWLKIADHFLLEKPKDFDETKLSWVELRNQLDDLNKMERGYASINVTEILKRIMDRIDQEIDV